MIIIVVDDSIHCEWGGKFKIFEDAIAELRRRAGIPWDQPPNRAPCTNWRTCGRKYDVLEYDDSRQPWKLLRRVSVLSVSADKVEWAKGFEQAWAAAMIR